MSFVHSHYAVLLISFPVIFVGCSKPVPVEENAAKQHLSALQQKYLEYVNTNRGATPPDEAAFKQFLSANKVSDVEAAFVSPRDKKPYVVKYGVRFPDSNDQGNLPPDQKPKVVIIHEQDGVKGKKLVATHSGIVLEAEDPASVK